MGHGARGAMGGVEGSHGAERLIVGSESWSRGPGGGPAGRHPWGQEGVQGHGAIRDRGHGGWEPWAGWAERGGGMLSPLKSAS